MQKTWQTVIKMVCISTGMIAIAGCGGITPKSDEDKVIIGTLQQREIAATPSNKLKNFNGQLDKLIELQEFRMEKDGRNLKITFFIKNNASRDISEVKGKILFINKNGEEFDNLDIFEQEILIRTNSVFEKTKNYCVTAFPELAEMPAKDLMIIWRPTGMIFAKK